MLTSILAALSSFIGGILSGFGIQSALGAVATASAGEIVVAGAGLAMISKALGQLLSNLLKCFIIFVLGMLIYRQFGEFRMLVDEICAFIESYIPFLQQNISNLIQNS